MRKTLINLARWCILAAILALSAGIGSTAQAPLPPLENRPAATILAEIERHSGDTLEVLWDETLNAPRFLAGDLSAGVRTMANGNPEATARAFFSAYRGLYGLRDPDSELRKRASETDDLGITHLRFDQYYQGVPVWGGQLVAHVTGDGRLQAVNGEYYAGIALDTKPTLSFAEAQKRALADVGDETATLRPERSKLVIYTGKGEPTLTWLVNLYSERVLGDWMVFVDARTGNIRHRYNNLNTAQDRRTFTANNSTLLPGTLVCAEADTTCAAGDTDARAAHINAGLVYSYYKTIHNRDSFNNAGATISSTVHYDVKFNNAFWSGRQMVYGDGDGIIFAPLARGLDVVAHELTHAVTEYTAELIYEDQSGALNESMSDIFGTLVEFYATPAQADWLIGEDVYTPGTAGDALRSMADPTQGVYSATLPARGPGQPDHMSIYAALPLWIDGGGVHINSGIPNKAAYLLAQGGTFHAVNVAGVGRSKMERVFYRALTQCLTPASNFAVARACTVQTAKDLFGNGSPEEASTRNAWAAVGVGARASQIQHLFMPAVLRNAADVPAVGIYGRVTLQGDPAPGIALELRLCTLASNGSVSCSVNDTTATDAQGIYKFTGRQATAANQWYYVYYENAPDTTKVALWLSDDISRYAANSARYGGSFEAADVALVSPSSPTTSTLPITFTWNRRSVNPPDLYDWELYRLNFAAVRTFILGLTGNSLTLSGLPTGASFGTTYLWGVGANNADGYAGSYFVRRITFSATSAAALGAASEENILIPRASLLTREAVDQMQYERFVRRP
ncbi:MAG: peptidase M4 family protein [Anaerolineae bacterium]|nr:peptidase M4 family protein [Anaerolineae bacterium]